MENSFYTVSVNFMLQNIYDMEWYNIWLKRALYHVTCISCKYYNGTKAMIVFVSVCGK